MQKLQETGRLRKDEAGMIAKFLLTLGSNYYEIKDKLPESGIGTLFERQITQY